MGKRMKAEPLSLKQPDNGWTGSEPRDSGKLWDAVRARPNTYVQGHLLNHNLFGPGTNENLTPIHGSKMNNPAMLNQVEKEIKDRVLDKNQVVSYEVDVIYGDWGDYKKKIPKDDRIEEEDDLATKFNFKAYEMKRKKKTTGEKAGDWELGNRITSIASTLPNYRFPD